MDRICSERRPLLLEMLPPRDPSLHHLRAGVNSRTSLLEFEISLNLIFCSRPIFLADFNLIYVKQVECIHAAQKLVTTLLQYYNVIVTIL